METWGDAHHIRHNGEGVTLNGGAGVEHDQPCCCNGRVYNDLHEGGLPEVDVRGQYLRKRDARRTCRLVSNAQCD